MQRPSTRRDRARLFEEATDVVRSDYASELTLNGVARRLFTSRRQLQRAFLEAGGTTFRAYVRAVRMTVAAGLLRTENTTVRDVARRVGYRQQAQFAKAFRSHFGVAPLEYRRRAAGVTSHAQADDRLAA